jgi:HTH-type transcriptional regulator/antitoxin HipB
MNFKVHFSSQLKPHLRALRKERKLTQKALGQLVGVGQARIAEIENNPGVVSVDQLMKVLSALHVSLILSDSSEENGADPLSASTRSPASGAQASSSPEVTTPSGGQQRIQPSTGAGKKTPESVQVSRIDTMSSSDMESLRQADPHAEVAPTSRRNYVIRPKKGSW